MGDELDSCKVVLLGESGVGKTSIITQFTEHNYFENPETTPGATFSSGQITYKDINKEIKFEIWDTAGQEKFRALTKMFYKDASAAILVYDITRIESFEEVRNYWSIQLKENAPKDLIIAVAANKSDLYEQEKVDEGAGRHFANSIQAIFKPTSAKNTKAIENLFYEIGLQFIKVHCSVDKNEDDEEKIKQHSGVVLNNNQQQSKQKKCCK